MRDSENLRLTIKFTARNNNYSPAPSEVKGRQKSRYVLQTQEWEATTCCGSHSTLSSALESLRYDCQLERFKAKVARSEGS
jgi:hypothetical protein